MNSDARWVSATAVGRMLRCPVSVVPRASPDIPETEAPNNAGSLAHLALGVWLESGDWKRKSPGTALQTAWDAEAAGWGIDWRRLREGVLVRARLGARGAELAQLIESAGTRARSEVLLADKLTGTFGALDLVVDGGERGGAVIDLKSGRDVGGDLDPTVRIQLLVYAHLFRAVHGKLPATVVAFSLTRGALPIEYSVAEVDELVARVNEIRMMEHPVAVPDEIGCRHCSRRLRCAPQWVDARQWPNPDCLEGRLTKVERAAGGTTAVHVETATGNEWVTNLDAGQAANLPPIGEHLRVVRVAKRQDSEWVASPATRVALSSPR